MKPVVFAVILMGAFAFFGRTIHFMVRAARRGVPDARPRFDQLPQRLLSVLVYFFGQKKVAERGPLNNSSARNTSYHHLLIFWGFLVITVATVELLIAGLVPGFSLSWFMPDLAYAGLRWLIDLLNMLVLVAIGYAVFRRIVLKPSLIPMNLDAVLILGAIASLMITHFLYHGLHAVSLGVTPHAAPVSTIVASYFADADPARASFAAEVAYWLHVAIVLTFLNYLPYSKHIHLLGAMPNIFLRNLSDRRLDMPKLDLEDESQWGVGKIEQFSWKSLVDNYACTECARCSNYCPAYTTGKNLSPMQLVHDLRYEMLDRDAIQTQIDTLEASKAAFNIDGDAQRNSDLEVIEDKIAKLGKELEDMPPMVGGRIAEDTLWACTTCGACQEVCPVFIEHPLKILQMRQNLVLEQEKTPGELGRTFRNLERQSNPWGIGNDKRTEWMEGLDVKTLEDHPNPEYILWVGCAGAFEARIIKQTTAMISILNQAGVDYAVLGHREGCTGDPARRAGNEMLFEMMAEANVETLNEAGAKKVIASCPHCLHTLRHDYPQFGGNFEVIHHTELIDHLLRKRQLKLAGDHKLGKVTYHDSCYLGRWNREFDAPRDIIERLPVAEFTELTRNRSHGFCCGAGGARMFMEEEGPRVNENRADEVIAAGVDTVAVACPFCSTMLTDGMKARNKEDEVQVLDIAELVAMNLPDVPASALVRNKPTSETD